jgi:hypothetical protein
MCSRIAAAARSGSRASRTLQISTMALCVRLGGSALPRRIHLILSTRLTIFPGSTCCRQPRKSSCEMEDQVRNSQTSQAAISKAVGTDSLQGIAQA